jgi:hypothetical protein
VVIVELKIHKFLTSPILCFFHSCLPICRFRASKTSQASAIAAHSQTTHSSLAAKVAFHVENGLELFKQKLL